MTYSAHRPKGYEGRADSRLPQLVRQLRQVLSDAQRRLAYDTLRLDPGALGELGGILVDFAEDVHNNVGRWEAYERYNVEFFGTALPLTSGESGGAGAGLHPDRFRHLLWVLYPALIDGLILAPTHRDLCRIADASSAFLSKAFPADAKDSGVKAFLRTPNVHGWHVKRKLVWLGTHSFMFRAWFARYLDEEAHGHADIGHTDDFVCQECTPWSGLGAIDVLAGALDISDDDRKDLRGWYERHAAFYRVLSVSDETLLAVNVINDQPYPIRIGIEPHPFEAGQLVFGSLVPWRGEWYWSGAQQLWGDPSKVDVEDLKRTMRRRSSNIVCRYSKDYEAQVRQRASEVHERTMTYYGKDLIVYRDGLSMAADWQKELRWHWESRPQHEVQEAIEKHGLTKGRPEVKLPKDLLDHKGGLGVFLNADEGKEIMTHFASLIAGLNRKGGTLTEDEQFAIRGFVASDAVSPGFVKRVLGEYGEESVKTAFMLTGDLPDYWLDYLLRTHKGHFYRRRYPCLSVA